METLSKLISFKYKLCGSLLFIYSILFCISPVSANTYYFNDEFDTDLPVNQLDTTKWIPYLNSTCPNAPATIWQKVESGTNGFLRFFQCSNSTRFPYVVSKLNPFPDGDYSVDLGFRYTKVTFWGTGISLADAAPQNGQNPSSVVNISVWQDKSAPTPALRITYENQNVYQSQFTNNTDYHTLKVDRVGKKFTVYLDNNLIYTSPDSEKKLNYIWMGNPSLQPPIPEWTEFKVDYIRVTQLSSQPTVYPVIFIPGIGGSELKTNSVVNWTNKDNGHGGTYSNLYSDNEKVWVNSDKAAELGNDDYFDILRLKNDGETSEANISPNGKLTSYGYADIEPFFLSLGYEKDKNFFIYTYDWRKDIKKTEAELDVLVEKAKQLSGQPKVNIVSHSMGGLVARNYIINQAQADKINKLITIGTPFLGTTKSIKTLMYGTDLTQDIFGIIPIGINGKEVRDILLNSPGLMELIPTSKYYDFYDNSTDDYPFPFIDNRDLDNNNVTASLNYSQLKTLLKNLSYNATILNAAEQFHNLLIPKLNQSNNVKLYSIVGTGQPTLGQIRELWTINWPINAIPRQEEIYINGDDTVPEFSASLKSNLYDLSAGAKVYYVDQTHSELVIAGTPSLNTVKAILSEADVLPFEAQSQKIPLEGIQIDVEGTELDIYDKAGNHTGIDSTGKVENKVPKTYFSGINNSKNVFIKKSAPKPEVKVTKKTNSPTTKTTVNIKINYYTQDKITKVDYFKDISLNNESPIQFNPDPTGNMPVTIQINGVSYSPTSQQTNLTDTDPPITNITIDGDLDNDGKFFNSATVTLKANDSESNILKTEYSLDEGLTIQNYTIPFVIQQKGLTKMWYRSIDSLGNEESPRDKEVEVKSKSTSSSSASSNDNSSSGNNSVASNTFQKISPDQIVKAAQTFFDRNIIPPAIAADEENIVEESASPSGSVLGVTTDDNSNLQTQENPYKNADKIISVIIVVFMLFGSTLLTMKLYHYRKKKFI